MEVSEKIRRELLYDPAIPFLTICPKEMKLISQRGICTPMVIVALFVIAKIGKHLKCRQMSG